MSNKWQGTGQEAREHGMLFLVVVSSSPNPGCGWAEDGMSALHVASILPQQGSHAYYELSPGPAMTSRLDLHGLPCMLGDLCEANAIFVENKTISVTCERLQIRGTISWGNMA